MDRRSFLGTGGTALLAGAAGGLLMPRDASAQATGPAYSAAPPLDIQKFHPQQQQFRVGYTTNTRGGWEYDPFIGMAEAREVGFRYVEIFGTVLGGSQQRSARAAKPNKVWPDGYVYSPPAVIPAREAYYPDRWEALQHRIYEIGIQFVCVNGGSPGGSMAFEDPAARQAVVDSHFNMARFSRRFGCDHQKINCGPRRQQGGKGVDETPLEDLKNIALTCDIIGKRCKEELGIKFGVHAHLSAQIATEQEINYLMENTNPDHVYFVLDTSMVNMAGIDPIALAKKLGNRICEYHFKDNAKNTLGGAKPRMVDMPVDPFNDPISYPMGEGGIDFPSLIDHLKESQWRGFLVIELETSPWRTPKDSAAITAKYLRETLKLEL